VVYGSDWPGNPYIRRNIEALHKLPLRDETKTLILGGNAARLLHLAEEATVEDQASAEPGP
jgi:predicted TIM-barrel fold metal-dependent hydrolase